MTRTVRIDHLARVEGHGGVTVELDDNDVRSVRFDVFEGARLLEGLVKGRTYQDVSTVLSRICAICSAAHAVTSLKATEAAFGVEVSPQTNALRDLLFLGESIESHALHLYLLALPDYLNYTSAIAMAAGHREAVQLGLRLKKLGNAIQETVGGRAVHPVNAVPGGFGRTPDTEQLIELHRGLQQAVSGAEMTISIFAGLPPAEFCHTDTAFAALRAPSQYGYYEGDEIEFLSGGEKSAYPCSRYREFTNERPVAHSHAKHSTHNGRPYMVGALARLSLNASKLSARAAQAVEQLGLELPSPNPMDNNKAQAVELVSDVQRALGIVESLLGADIAGEAPVPVVPRAGTGTAVTEAPRGLLIHSYTYDEAGRIVTANVVTPTALNAASVEDHLRAAALGAAPGGDQALTRAMEMIVRAYDPCISCSVHLIRHA